MGDDRQRILRTLWQRIRGLNAENVGNYPAAARLIEAGAEPADVVRAMTAAAYAGSGTQMIREARPSLSSDMPHIETRALIEPGQRKHDSGDHWDPRDSPVPPIPVVTARAIWRTATTPVAGSCSRWQR